MANRLFLAMMARVIRHGTLTLTLPDGSTHRFGDGSTPAVTARITDPGLPGYILRNPEMAIGDGYMNGTLTFADDDLHSFLHLIILNGKRSDAPSLLRAVMAARKGVQVGRQWNTRLRSRRNVAQHYDLTPEFYALFLEREMQYTCAYFATGTETLEQAQAAKIAHIAAKLRLRPGLRVLDIGCGWGGLCLALARDHGVHATGITLSHSQRDAAEARARVEGLSDRVSFRLQDYRAVPDSFDRIVSVGMMEHVGTPHYGAYFTGIARMLAPDGVALIHSIGRSSPPADLSPWFQTYIFPGGYVPALSEVVPHIERSGLILADLEVWRGHYDRTLRHWQTRFDANLPRVRALYDERFVRMWRYYLVSAELSFSLLHQVVFQMQLTNSHAAVPLTRDYLYP